MKSMLMSFLLLAGTLFAAEPSSYSGQWENLKNGDKGILTVTSILMEDQTWKTTFVGKLDEAPFDYEIIMKVVNDTEKKKANHPLKLAGSVSAGGAMSTLSVNMDEKNLTGQFRSSSSHGEFRLTRIE